MSNCVYREAILYESLIWPYWEGFEGIECQEGNGCKVSFVSRLFTYFNHALQCHFLDKQLECSYFR